jgi:hypothetical protein
MTNKTFAVGVMDAYMYDSSDNLIFRAKTMIDSALDVKLAVTDIRGGRGNQLLYKYYHTAAMTVTLTDAQFNLDMLAAASGEGISTGSSVYTEETCTLSGLSGTITGTPVADQGTTTIYGWVTLPDNSVQTVTFATKTFTVTGSTYSGAVVCVRYFNANAATKNFTIYSNILPKQGRLVLEGLLTSGDVSSNKIGLLQVIIPKASLLGDFNLAMKSNGVSQTPLKAEALSFTDTTSASCGIQNAYAYVNEILDSAHFYDGMTQLSISGGDFTLASTTATKTLVVYGIIPNQVPVIIENSLLTFASSATGKATVGASTGIVQGVSTGSAVISVYVTGVATINGDANCTIP